MMAKNFDEPDFSQISFLPGTVDFEKSEEALRLRYVLLFLYANRLISHKDSDGVNFDTADREAALTLLGSSWRKSSDKIKDSSYPQLMHEVRDELNFFINGDKFPRKSSDNNFQRHISNPKFLDYIALVLGDLDGITGFILAGNESCSDDLLNELQEFDYQYKLTFSSTKIRAQDTLQIRNRNRVQKDSTQA